MNITANVLDAVLPVKETDKTRMSKEHLDRGYRAEKRPQPLAVDPKKVPTHIIMIPKYVWQDYNCYV